MPLSSQKQILRELIRKSAVLSKADQNILLDRLESFTEEKIGRLIGLFQQEQNRITLFYNEMQQLKAEYRHALKKDKQKMRECIEARDPRSADRLMDDFLKAM